MKTKGKEYSSMLDPQVSLQEVSDKLVTFTRELIQNVKTEEDLRIGFEKLLEPILRIINITPAPRYERLGAPARSVYKGRPDAVHGQVIIEYKSPGKFSSESVILQAHEQLAGYLLAESQIYPADPSIILKRLMGVGFDGLQIFFVKYQPREDGANKEIDIEDFTRHGPYWFDIESARTFLTFLRALSRLPLTAENLADKFGPKSKIAPQAVSAFLDALKHWGGERVNVFFNEWDRLFGIVYGEQFAGKQLKETEELSKVYGLDKEVDFK